MKARLILLMTVFVAGGVSLSYGAQVHKFNDMLFFSGVSFGLSFLVTLFNLRKKQKKFAIPIPKKLEFWNQPLLQGKRSFQDEYDLAIFTIVFGLGWVLIDLLLGRQFAYDGVVAIAWGLGFGLGLIVFLKIKRGNA